MKTKGITPILNVSDMQKSFEWFEKIGWQKGWDWGTPVSFGGVCSGETQIFLCLNGQGGRGKGDNTATFKQDNGETADKGVFINPAPKYLQFRTYSKPQIKASACK